MAFLISWVLSRFHVLPNLISNIRFYSVSNWVIDIVRMAWRRSYYFDLSGDLINLINLMRLNRLIYLNTSYYPVIFLVNIMSDDPQ